MVDEVVEVMKTTGSARYFKPDDVPDEVLLGALDAARFGPSGGNRQPVRWIVVRDPAIKGALADLYLPLWKRDMEAFLGGQMATGSTLGPAVKMADDFAENLRDVPVILVACAVLGDMHAHMSGPDGPNMLAGSSVYPIVQNACLALRAHGVASTITTLICEREEEAAAILDLPDGIVCACHIAVGYPARPFPTKLTRLSLEELVSYDRFSAPV
jgi:nitroreductase